MANTWITNLVSGLRIAGSLKLLALGFSPADVVALIMSAQRSAVFLPVDSTFGYEQAA